MRWIKLPANFPVQIIYHIILQHITYEN